MLRIAVVALVVIWGLALFTKHTVLLVLAVMTFFPSGLVGVLGALARHNRVHREGASARGATSVAAAPASANIAQNVNGAVALQIDDLSVSFGAMRAVDHFSLRVFAGTVHGLIGPNGAGKTTLFNAISGFVSVKVDVRARSP